MPEINPCYQMQSHISLGITEGPVPTPPKKYTVSYAACNIYLFWCWRHADKFNLKPRREEGQEYSRSVQELMKLKQAAKTKVVKKKKQSREYLIEVKKYQSSDKVLISSESWHISPLPIDCDQWEIERYVSFQMNWHISALPRWGMGCDRGRVPAGNSSLNK